MTQVKWQRRYKQQADQPPTCPQHVLKLLQTRAPGRLLDLACGDGAVALMAARMGWEVRGVDFSEEALVRLNRFAQAEGLMVDTEVMDLERDLNRPAPDASKTQYDLICLCRYKAVHTLYGWCADQLALNGELVVTTFNLNHHLQTGFNRRFILEPQELLHVDPRLACQSYFQDGDALQYDIYRFTRTDAVREDIISANCDNNL
ncbi:class I SAM-dependent methyltransferase [Aurantivibrio plasticivorans]